jgi:hypothetical protein
MALYSDAHIVPTSVFILWIQGTIILLSLAVIGLTSYAVNSQNHMNTYTDSGNAYGDAIVSTDLIHLYASCFHDRPETKQMRIIES